jgi:hypothetical protein
MISIVTFTPPHAVGDVVEEVPRCIRILEFIVGGHIWTHLEVFVEAALGLDERS